VPLPEQCPILGTVLNLYLIYAAFFSALWSAPFRTGRSVVIACLTLFALQLFAGIYLRLFRRDLLTAGAPMGVALNDSPGSDQIAA